MRDHVGDHPTNERRPCKLRTSSAGGTRVGIQTGRFVGHPGTHLTHPSVRLKRHPRAQHVRECLQQTFRTVFLVAQHLSGP